MNIKIQIAYDGARYSGWQRNKNADQTIQYKLEEIIGKYFDESIQVIGAGRTDKGVHSQAMVANFHLDRQPKGSPRQWQMDLNGYLPADIAIRSMEEVDDRFHSRFNAKEKTYVYTFYKSYMGVKPIFTRKYMAPLTDSLKLDQVEEAIGLLEGCHDFRGFSSDKTKKSTERCLHSIEVVDDPDTLQFKVTGDGFLYHMVRILVGTLVEVGQGNLSLDSIEEVFESKDRKKAGFTAKAEGLTLVNVRY